MGVPASGGEKDPKFGSGGFAVEAVS